jgi:hypothetical protein
MEWFFIIAVVVAVVTLVGHGVWVLLATICRALFAGFREPQIRCRHCGHNSTMTGGRCQRCGPSLCSPPADEQADLAAVTRQLERWQSRGVVKPRTVERLLNRIEAYHKSLTAAAMPPKKVETVEPVLAEIVEPKPATTTPVRVPPPRRTAPKLAPTLPVAPATAAVATPHAAPRPRRSLAEILSTFREEDGLPSPSPSTSTASEGHPPSPRRSLAEILSTFMEERNIRWGELVGGLLIVGSSVALVISIWEQLTAIPYFQFLIFVTVSAALFGIGLYTEHRWKLTSTSHGVLIIATLLVPLNFVAMVATRRAGFDPWALGTELAALAVFLALVQRAGKVLVDSWAWWLTAAVVGSSGMLLLLLGRPVPAWAFGVGSVATAVQIACVGGALFSIRQDESFSATVVSRLFIMTGIASFTLAVTLCMAALRSADRLATAHALAPLVALGGTSIVLCGLAVVKGMTNTSEQPGLRTAGTAVALVGATIMLAAIGVAWPMPLSLVAVGVFNFASLATIAWRHRLQPLHVMAAACLAVGYVVACHLIAGHLAIATASDAMTLAMLFIDGQTGLWLVGFVILLALIAQWLVRREHQADAIYYLASSAVAAAISLSLVTWPVLAGGGDHALRAAAAYAAFGMITHGSNLPLRRPALGNVATLLLYAAALFATTSWLIDQPWVAHDPAQLASRHSLQWYAAAWAALSFLCVVSRLSLRERTFFRGAKDDDDARPAIPQNYLRLTDTLDRWLLRITVVASLLLAIWQATPGVATEFLGRAGMSTVDANAMAGWALFGAAACALVAALWDGWRDDDLAAAVLLSVNAALLASIPASTAWATASALRWGLATCFVGGAAMLWFRESFAEACLWLRCRLITTAAAPHIARSLWLVTAALPVVVCSAAMALMQIGGHPPAGPLPGTWFAKLGLEVSHLLPLALIVIGLTAYAVRECSPVYAFLGGLVANLTAIGGYALIVPRFGAVEAARLLQLATIVPAVWAIGWLACRRLVLTRSGREASQLSRPLLRLQVAQSALGNLLLVATASAALFLASPVLPTWLHNWAAAVGSPWGWLALIAAAGAGAYRIRHFGEILRPDLVGLLGMAALSLAACGVEAVVPQTPWAYRAMMLGWAMYAISIVAATWWTTASKATTDAPRRSQALMRAAALWVRLAGLLAVTLGLKTVFLEGIGSVETLWAAGAIGIASTACAAMAVWLRREGWAFTAGMGVNLAALLAVCHQLAVGHRVLADEWVLLWQANVIAGGLVALVWLAARRRLYLGRDLSPLTSPLLTLQVGWVYVAALGLIAVPAGLIVWLPRGEDAIWQQLTTSAGWFAWLFASGAIGGYIYHAARRATVDVLNVFLLGLGVLLAATRMPVDAAVAYQTLMTAWLAAGFSLLAAGWVTHGWLNSVGEPITAVGDWLRPLLLKRRLEMWTAVIAFLTAAIAARGAIHDAAWGQPLGLRLFVAAAIAGAFAVWLRRPHHLYASGLLTNLAISLLWYAQPEPLWADLVFANALALAATAILWTAWSLIAGPIGVHETEPLLPFEHAATALAVSLVVLSAAWSWLAAWLDRPLPAGDWLVWTTLSATVTACLLSLWDRRTALGFAGVYCGGLSAVALAMVHQGWRGDELMWVTTLALAGWICAAALARQITIPIAVRERLRLPATRNTVAWFSPTQAALGLLCAAMGIWTCLHFDFPRDRLAGPISTSLLLAAAVSMTRRATGFWVLFFRVTAILLIAMVPAELGWAWVSGGNPAILWLHREGILLGSLAAVIAGCEFIASRWLSTATRWLDAIQRFLPLAICVVLVLLSVVFVQEIDYSAALPHAPDGTRQGVPMALAAKLTVIASLVELIMLVLRYAVVGQRDPLGLSLRGRTAYVYAAELLALAICLHIRVTLPKLLPFGILENWWTLVVMIVAFCGAGLSELFSRRKLDVLSEPLRRTALAAPLLPVLALGLYLVWQPTDIESWVFRARLVDDEAVFFLIAVFYGVQGWLRRSITFWGFSALAANAGFWLLWHRLHLEFLVHPQLWLIPPALAMLVAEYLNHGRLSRQQSDAVRYVALSMIYVSSTADVFISHVGHDISVPLILVLMGLSVSGILSGMLLQVRSFLYLGFSFLLVDLSIMVYHAAWDLGHTWVFWASGIAVGVAILALFAVFEKRRNEAARQIGGGK